MGAIYNIVPQLTIEDRFWKKVEPEPNSGCWLWMGTQDRYGQFRIGGRNGHQVGAHRVAWMLANGLIPMGVHVLHRCDIPTCVNPSHLFLGTRKDNMQDAARKGRLGPQSQKRKICARGHPLGDSNVYISRADSSRPGERYCRTCKRVANLRYYHSRRKFQEGRL